MSTRVILDTDIGTDVDDAWALALCLASNEIELLGVTLVHADLDVRARIALKMLKLARRVDIPVLKGLSDPLTPGARTYWAGHEGTETDFSDTEDLAARDGAVDFILDTVDRYPSEVIVCHVGPMTNIAGAIKRSPQTMGKVKRLVIMATTFEGEGWPASGREHNSCADPVATKTVLESGIPAIVVGLNVTMRVCVRREDMRLIQTSDFGRYLAAMTSQYYEVIGKESTQMHDPLAVSTIIDRSVVTTRRMSANVLEDGAVAYTHDRAGSLDVCVDVDVGRFEKTLLSRVASFSAALVNPNQS